MPHENLNLKLSHVVQAHRRLDDDGRKIYVWTDLSPDRPLEIAALRKTLRKLHDDDPLEYDEFWFYLKGSADAQRA